MSTCGGMCACGSCGSACTCGMCPDLEKSAAVTIIEGVAPLKMNITEEGSEKAEGGNGCKCGSSCKCNPCNC